MSRTSFPALHFRQPSKRTWRRRLPHQILPLILSKTTQLFIQQKVNTINLAYRTRVTTLHSFSRPSLLKALKASASASASLCQVLSPLATPDTLHQVRPRRHQPKKPQLGDRLDRLLSTRVSREQCLDSYETKILRASGQGISGLCGWRRLKNITPRQAQRSTRLSTTPYIAFPDDDKMNVLLAQPPVFPHQHENSRLSPSRGSMYFPCFRRAPSSAPGEPYQSPVMRPSSLGIACILLNPHDSSEVFRDHL